MLVSTVPTSEEDKRVKWVVRSWDVRLPLGIKFLCYWRTVIVLSDYPRWMFRKNLMKFFIGLSYYLYYFTSGCTLKSCSHEFFQNILWSHDSGHMVHLLKFPCYLYLDPIVCLDVMDQIFKYTGNYFLFGALIISSNYIIRTVVSKAVGVWLGEDLVPQQT